MRRIDPSEYTMSGSLNGQRALRKLCTSIQARTEVHNGTAFGCFLVRLMGHKQGGMVRPLAYCAHTVQSSPRNESAGYPFDFPALSGLAAVNGQREVAKQA